jgi:hypothetical protein
MRTLQALVGLAVVALLATPAWAAQRGVTELGEGTVRNVYVEAPLVGAKGYLVADWEAGQVRVEVKNFPASATGYEVFLFEIDIPAYMGAMFVDGDSNKGIVANPPPFSAAAALISQWKSLGDLDVDDNGNGTLSIRNGGNIAETGLNMMMIFAKVTPGQHAGPEDFSKLMVECNGPLMGLPGSEAMASAIKVFPR